MRPVIFAIALSLLVLSIALPGCSGGSQGFPELLSKRQAGSWNVSYDISSGIENAPNSSAIFLSGGNATLWSFQVAGNKITNYAIAGNYYSCIAGESGESCFASSKPFGAGAASKALADFESDPANPAIEFIGDRQFAGVQAHCFSMEISDGTRVFECLTDYGVPAYQKVELNSSPYSSSYVREAASIREQAVSISPPSSYSFVEMPGIGGDFEGGIGLDCVQTCNMAGSREEISFCLKLCLE